MDRIIIWSIDAQISRRVIFNYWNNRNKSKVYSKKLNEQFLDALLQVSKFPSVGKNTDINEVQLKIVSHFQIIYQATSTQIIVLYIWDSRQNSENFPIK